MAPPVSDDAERGERVVEGGAGGAEIGLRGWDPSFAMMDFPHRHTLRALTRPAGGAPTPHDLGFDC